MRYVSTRGDAPLLRFDDTVIAGLASDGGLYLPERWPRFTPDALRLMRDLDYPALCARVIAAFAVPAVSEAELGEIAADAYRSFGHEDVAPLKPIGEAEWMLELFHGPTLAFKDYALQVLGRLFELVLTRRGTRMTIVGATSGDTGSAAIEACRDRPAIEIFMLHPKGRVSEVQRRQMTTVTSANVHNIAIEGTFDDCQALVKDMFNDAPFRERFHLGAVNSINWARIVAQVVYYVRAALALGAPDRPVSFAVPTGNFGNVFSGYVARCIGVPIKRLIIGSNRNDILTRFFATGRMELGEVFPTLSPSMDIQVSSNFERLLFELYDRDGAAVRRLMAEFREHRAFAVEPERLRRAQALFTAVRFDDEETKAAIRDVFAQTGELIDPHSAIGVAASRAASRDDGRNGEVPTVVLATAHAAKFPEPVAAATGVRPALPPRLAHLFELAERCEVLPPDLSAIEGYVATTLTRREAVA
jgi:threonine synthase